MWGDLLLVHTIGTQKVLYQHSGTRHISFENNPKDLQKKCCQMAFWLPECSQLWHLLELLGHFQEQTKSSGNSVPLCSEQYIVASHVLYYWRKSWLTTLCSSSSKLLLFVFQIVQWQTTGRRSGPTWRSRPTRRTVQKRIGTRRKWWSPRSVSGCCQENCSRGWTREIQKSWRHRIGRAKTTRFFSHILIEKRELCLNFLLWLWILC